MRSRPTRAPRSTSSPGAGAPFVARTAAGDLTDSLTADHRYWWNGRVQRGRLIDRYPDGRLIRATARNFVRDDTLYCVVEPEGGGAPTVLTGRVEDGAIIWHRRGADGASAESYRERVVPTPEGPAYWIDGFGAYPADGTFLHFIGRYRRVPADSGAAS